VHCLLKQKFVTLLHIHPLGSKFDQVAGTYCNKSAYIAIDQGLPENDVPREVVQPSDEVT